jgi:membrane protein
VNRAQALLDRARATKLLRAWDRYGRARGNVLAGGIAYFAFFSLFPALALGFTVFGLVLGRETGLQARVVEYVNTAFGGVVVIGSVPGKGVVSMDQLALQSSALTLYGAIGLVVLAVSGLGWVGALRDGVSAIFGRVQGPNPVLAKVGDLGILAGLGVGVLASATVSVLVSAATGPVLDRLGMGRTEASGIVVTVLTSLLLLGVDTLLFLLVFRQLSGVRLPLDDLFTAALAGGAAVGLLKVSGGVLLRLLSGNRFLAAFSIVVGLLLWMNLVARVALLAAAWAATTAQDHGHLPAPVPPGGESLPGDGQRAAVTTPGFVAAGTIGTPTYGERAGDRATLLAGAVLGATAAVGLRALAGAGRTARDLLRRRD